MPLSIIIDLLLAAVFGLLVWRGRRRGFLGAMLSLGRLVLSFLLTVAFGPAVSAWADETLVHPPVYASIHAKFTQMADEVSAAANGSVEALAQRIPGVFREHLDLEGLDPTADVRAVADRWALTVSESISKVIATVVGYVALFALCFVLLTVALILIRKLIHGIGLLRAADQLLGSILGAVSGCVAVLLLSAVLGAVLSVMGRGDAVDASLMLRLSAGVREMLFDLS